MKRVLTALALIPVIAYVVLLGPGWLFLGVVAVVAALCYGEYAGIAAAHGFQTFGPIGYAAGLWLLVAPQEGLLIVIVLALLALALSMRAADLAQSLPAAAAFLLGMVYIFGAWKYAILLRGMNPHWLMYVLALNWIGDTAAYYAGRGLGRHKLAPRISPNKSWEGAAGSVIASSVFGYFYLTAVFAALPAWHAVLLSILANLAGQIGDLAESALKRGANVKDSGRYLPGHGGWLDRVDSTLFSLPTVYIYLRASLG